MARWIVPSELVTWIERLAQPLDARVRWRLLLILIGVLFAHGRRTVSRWIQAAGVSHDYQDFYYFVGSIGRKSEWIATELIRLLKSQLPIGDRILLALDDTPTKRYGPKVEGAGIHHNPTPGPADAEFLYGHVWVTLAWVIRHPWWGTLGLPLWSKLYVRACDVPKLLIPWTFQTKLQLAARMVIWAAGWLSSLGKTIWCVADGAYAKQPFLKPLIAVGVVVVSRLRKDAALYSVPTGSRPDQRGRPRKYGTERLSLAKRAAHRDGWETGEFTLYGKRIEKTYKTFLATYRPVGGLIRVVIVREEHGWMAFFCTDPNASVQDMLEAVADRSAIEQDFHDVKEVHGAGEQQVRNIWANIGAWHLTLWLHTLIELWSWHRESHELTDRSDRPWDNPDRRPSHQDRRNALRRECLRQTFSPSRLGRDLQREIRRLLDRIVQMVT